MLQHLGLEVGKVDAYLSEEVRNLGWARFMFTTSILARRGRIVRRYLRKRSYPYGAHQVYVTEAFYHRAGELRIILKIPVCKVQ